MSLVPALLVDGAGFSVVALACLAIDVCTRRPRMSPQERFLRWYTGRQIPAQASEQPGWYPQDVPVLQARKRPLRAATVDESFLVRGSQGRYPQLPADVRTSRQIEYLVARYGQARPAEAAQIITACPRCGWPWAADGVAWEAIPFGIGEHGPALQPRATPPGS